VDFFHKLVVGSLSLTEAGARWAAWTFLVGSFLGGMLLVLRATGYLVL